MWMLGGWRLVGLPLLASFAYADAVKPTDIYVVDGDTIEALGRRIRLVGFDAPELGGHAPCGFERMLAARHVTPASDHRE
jgi:endonuclease YncB( thermonuclease family)